MCCSTIWPAKIVILIILEIWWERWRWWISEETMAAWCFWQVKWHRSTVFAFSNKSFCNQNSQLFLHPSRALVHVYSCHNPYKHSCVVFRTVFTYNSWAQILLTICTSHVCCKPHIYMSCGYLYNFLMLFDFQSFTKFSKSTFEKNYFNFENIKNINHYRFLFFN